MYNTVGELVGAYETFVYSRFKQLLHFDQSLLHAAVGISGEAGEFLDAVKKTWIYGKKFDHVNGIEELGDIFFYVFAAMQVMNVSLEQVLLANMDKLKKRYPNGYADAAAIVRADKQECTHEGKKEIRRDDDTFQDVIYCCLCNKPISRISTAQEGTGQ